MRTLQEYINESILESKVTAPKNVEEWFKEAVLTNKKDFGEDKKIKQSFAVTEKSSNLALSKH